MCTRRNRRGISRQIPVSYAPILKVAVNVPLSRAFDYLPAGDSQVPPAGCRVLVPFGRRRQAGLVVAHAKDSELPAGKIRRSIATLDTEPLLEADDLWLLRFASGYYHHPIGEVVATALPALLRQGRPLYPEIENLAIGPDGEHTDLEALARRAPRQAGLLELLRDAGGNGVDAGALTELMPDWRRIVKPLVEKGLILRYTTRGEEPRGAETAQATPGPELNIDQRRALESIRSTSGYGTFLLDGVTGSGKTEIYLRILRDVIGRGKQALVLVPEIGLTPQLVARLRDRLGIEPAILHSGLGDAERLRAWRDARSGAASLVVGTRSAVFTPLPDLAVIVVDEEHDPSFKQQEGLRYSARDLAIARARLRDVPVVLGSATPTLEVLQHCREGRFTRLELPRRAGGALPPSLQLVDLNRFFPTDGLSEPLVDAIRTHLDADGQVLMFLNRRGFAPTLICRECGHVAECRRCDSRMTVHAGAGQLRCHHCGAVRRLDTACEACGAEVVPLGEGTQRLEQALAARFPDHTVRRIDSDSMQARGAIDEALALAEHGAADILVGTQMLSKGHHFPKLTLVGVINADQGLFSADFRAGERLAQSIVQVAGRAGRETRPGQVFIQTAFPRDPFWASLMDGGYAKVAADALAERETAGWPPFSRLALLRAAAPKHSDAHALLEAARQRGEAAGLGRVRVLGPVDAPMARKAGRYRAQLLLQSADRRALHGVLAELRSMLESEPAGRRARWSIDVDPIELF
jgi:primosomal protein N' (replication factor Y) (superfamily II helicase)